MPKRPTEYVCIFKVELFGNTSVIAMDEHDAKITFHAMDEQKVLLQVQHARTILLGVSKRDVRSNGAKKRIIQ